MSFDPSITTQQDFLKRYPSLALQASQAIAAIADPTPVATICELAPDTSAFDELFGELVTSEPAVKATATVTPLDGALRTAGLHVRVAPVKAKDKFPPIADFPNLATTEESQINAWAVARPDCNWLALATSDTVCFIDEDRSEKFRALYQEKYGEPFPVTRTTESRPGHRQSCWLQTDRTRAFGNRVQGKFEDGMLSFRQSNEYCLCEGSVHPSGSIYTIVTDAPIAPMPDKVMDLIQSLLVDAPKKITASDDGGPIPDGERNDTLASIAGALRRAGLDRESIEEQLHKINAARCTPPLPDDDIAIIAGSISRYDVGHPENELVTFGGVPAGAAPHVQKSSEPVLFDNREGDDVTVSVDDDVVEEAIPPFDPSVINGIYARFVDLVTRGTTLAPQFAYVIAKTIVGLRMAGKVSFDILDAEPRYYTALIGETGSGKGAAIHRIEKLLTPEGATTTCKIKFIESPDSGAGLKDTFFEVPEDHPVLCYVDEVSELGNKSVSTRNPGILDVMLTLADRTSISRVLAKSRGGTKVKNNARLAMVMCGQTGSVYMQAMAGKSVLGMFDRISPEHGVAQETGDMPPVDVRGAYELQAALNSLDYSGTMVMEPEAKDRLDSFWKGQSAEVRKKARWKKNLQLDAYMSAFGCGRKNVTLDDAEIAIKICVRQLVIRRVCFTAEVPDKIGYYIGLIKAIRERMLVRIAAGVPLEQVAKSQRDFQTATHAFRDNEGHTFHRAWQSFAPVWLKEVKIRKANGQEYIKYLPATDD